MTEHAELTALLGRDPGAYTAAPLVHNAGNSVTAGIWRYAGDGWSVVLKHVTPHGSGAAHWVTTSDPRHWNYWQREPLAYRSGLPATAYRGSGVSAPVLLASYDRPGGGVALWLEDVAGRPGEDWDLRCLATFARRLGRGQGEYLSGRPLPGHRWLSKRWLRQYVGSKPVDGSVLHDDTRWDDGLIRTTYAGLRCGLTRLWDDREVLLDQVEAMPQTLCHLDVWPKNLVERGESFVLLDWAFVGIGAVGEDAGNLVPDSVWDGFVPPAQLRELATAVWEQYLAGLRDAGWAGDERLARLGFTAGGAVKYAWLAEWSMRRLRAGDLRPYGGYGTLDPQRLLETYAAVFDLLLEWADEARSLAKELT